MGGGSRFEPYDSQRYHVASNIRGWSGRFYCGSGNNNTISNIFSEGIYSDPSTIKYLYHGYYQNNYGVYYLINVGLRNTGLFYYRNGSEVVMITGEQKLNVQGKLLSEMIIDPELSQYFDVIPSVWIQQYLNAARSYKYNLCFISQSDIEEFLNTYWKYEGGN